MATLTFRIGKGYATTPLVSTTNLYEHEVLFFSPGSLYVEMKAGKLVDESEHKAVVARMAELVKWVERGHTLIVFGLAPMT